MLVRNFDHHSHLSRIIGGIATAATLAALVVPAQSASTRPRVTETEDYQHVLMPPGVKVVVSPLEGPVFADAKGHTLYRWPRKALRNGDVGEEAGASPQCNNVVARESAGLESPYPAGLLMPDLDTRPTCAQEWPPLLASSDAKPVGSWTIVARKDGSHQWAYNGQPMYTSMFDREPGDTYGGTKRLAKLDAGAYREPVGPPPAVPLGFAIAATAAGRLLVTTDNLSVYASDRDTPKRSNCDEACTNEWQPLVAPEAAHPIGEWTIIERSPGIRQWVFRGSPLYKAAGHEHPNSLKGSDSPGWHNVYTMRLPDPPEGFTLQDTRGGQVLADARGRTIYLYACADDAPDQLTCDHPDVSQAMRFVICGGGSPERCVQTFPYVLADRNAKSSNRVWTIMDIDPKTGHRATPGQNGALHVWAYRDRPLYTFVDDLKPGDINADAWGEYTGWRNGFKAFWLRDDFFNNTG